MDGRFTKEYEALTDLTRLMAEAVLCKRRFEEAGLPIPRPLAVLLDVEAPPAESRPSQPPAIIVEVPPLPRPRRSPRRSSAQWLYLPIEEAQETSLVLAVLTTNMPVAPLQVVEMVQAVRPQVNKGTIANVGSRLAQEEIICRDENGWRLKDEHRSLEIIDDYIWGPPSAFQKQELAAYRRMAILHVLRSISGGLQTSQITQALEKHCPWFDDDTIPVTKFLVKADMEALAERKLVKKIGGTKKWGLTQ